VAFSAKGDDRQLSIGKIFDDTTTIMTTTVSEPTLELFFWPNGNTTLLDLKLTIFRLVLGHPRFFLGTDSAPHPRTSKEAAASSAGVFTSPYVLQYTAHILESFGALDRLRGFACEYGRRFYRVEKPPHGEVTLARKEMKVVDELKFKDDEGKEASVVPFLAGRMLNWSIQ
jgi:dihydroorotase